MNRQWRRSNVFLKNCTWMLLFSPFSFTTKIWLSFPIFLSLRQVEYWPKFTICFFMQFWFLTQMPSTWLQNITALLFFCIRIPTMGSDLNVWLWVGGHASGVLQEIALLTECVICRGEWERALRALSLTLLAVDLSALFLVGQDMSLQLPGIIAVPSTCCQASLPLDPWTKLNSLFLKWPWSWCLITVR